MASLTLTVETQGFERLAGLLQAAGKRIEPEVAKAINQVGQTGKIAIMRALPGQTGLNVKVVRRFLRNTQPATAGKLSFFIKGQGGDIGLKYFGAHEVAGGVSAAPWNRQRMYAGAFFTSGRAPNRSPSSKLGGQVYQNTSGGRWGGEIEKAKSGLFLPKEMVTGQSAEAWTAAVDTALPAAIDAAIRRALTP